MKLKSHYPVKHLRNYLTLKRQNDQKNKSDRIDKYGQRK